MAVTASQLMPLRGEKRWAYLARAKTIRIATLSDDGSIYLSPLWLVVHEKRIYIPVDAASRHAANTADGRVLSGLVDGGDEYATMSGVRMHGRMEKVDDPALLGTLSQLVFEKYFHVGHPYAESYLEFREAVGHPFYELIPEKLIGWDMREGTTLAMPESRTLPPQVSDRLA